MRAQRRQYQPDAGKGFAQLGKGLAHRGQRPLGEARAHPQPEALPVEAQSLEIKVDTDANPGLSSAAGIRSIPTLMVFRDGVLVFSVGGGNREKNISVNLVRALEAEGLHLEHLQLHAPTLDDVFLAKTGRKLDAGDEEGTGEHAEVVTA